MSYHPIQLNFGGLVNNSTLSDIKLKATCFNEAKIDGNPHQILNSDSDESKDDNKCNESNISLLSLDEEDNDNDNDSPQTPKQPTNGIIHCHWDILRSRCIIFDLIFHAITTNKLDQLPTKDEHFHIDIPSNTIHFNVSYKALLIVIKYLYTGLTRRYDYDDISIARDVLHLADLLHLNQLRVDINGQFLYSRKHLKDQQLSDNINDIQHEDTLKEWKAMKLDTFNFNHWNKQSQRHFLNINVLYHYDQEMYQNISSRQVIKINDRTFQISKIIFVSVSEYFKAMFCGNKGGSWRESQSDPNGDVIEMKGVNADHFEIMIRFIYTFDQSIYYDAEHGKLNDYDFDTETVSEHTVKKKKLLNITLKSLHLSIYFGINDLRQCLVLTIDKYYLCKNTLFPFWNLGIEYELKDVKELCINYFTRNFGEISSDEEIFYLLTKDMIKAGLSNGKIAVNTQHMIQVLLNWAHHHQTSIQELLPPNTLFNEANKSFVLCNRRAINLQHLLRL